MPIDGQICTPDGEEPPVLGKPFLESTNSKASRKRGEAGSDGVDSFTTVRSSIVPIPVFFESGRVYTRAEG